MSTKDEIVQLRQLVAGTAAEVNAVRVELMAVQRLQEDSLERKELALQRQLLQEDLHELEGLRSALGDHIGGEPVAAGLDTEIATANDRLAAARQKQEGLPLEEQQLVQQLLDLKERFAVLEAELETADAGISRALCSAVEAKDMAGARRALEDGATPNWRAVVQQGRGRVCRERSALVLAAAVADCMMLELLLDHDADPDVGKDDSVGGGTALFVAALCGNVDMARLLLDRGAKPGLGRSQSTPLMCAALNDQLEMARLLLDRGADPTGTPAPLSLVAGANRLEMARLLLDRGADPNRAKLLSTACGEQNLNCECDPPRSVSYPLYCATAGGHLEMASLLLDRGADPNEGLLNGSDTPLACASLNGRFKLTRLLLDRGADLTIGKDSLAGASRNGHLEVVRLLLDRGADLDKAAVYGLTPLLHAATHSHFDVMRLLLDRGADPNGTGENNQLWRPLHISSVRGDLRSVQILVSFGADATAATEDGFTALGLCNSLANAQNANPDHATIADFLQVVATWPALKIAMACRLHSDIKSALKLGRIDPTDGCTLAELAVLASSPANALWPGSPAPCPLTTRLCKDAMSGWSPARHHLYHAGVKDNVPLVLLVAERLRRRKHLSNSRVPLLPLELWLVVCSLFTRGDWEVPCALAATAVRA